jgi:hypothetical protein
MLLDRGGRRRRNLEPSDAFDNDTEIIGTPSRPNLRRAEAASEIEAMKTRRVQRRILSQQPPKRHHRKNSNQIMASQGTPEAGEEGRTARNRWVWRRQAHPNRRRWIHRKNHQRFTSRQHEGERAIELGYDGKGMILFSVLGTRFELERLEIRAGGGRQRGTLFYYDSPEWRHRRRWWGARRSSRWR